MIKRNPIALIYIRSFIIFFPSVLRMIILDQLLVLVLIVGELQNISENDLKIKETKSERRIVY